MLVGLGAWFASGSVCAAPGLLGVEAQVLALSAPAVADRDLDISEWTWTAGRDGRRVAYPSSGWTWAEGNDGRRVAYPFQASWTQSPDGRRILSSLDGIPGVKLSRLMEFVNPID